MRRPYFLKRAIHNSRHPVNTNNARPLAYQPSCTRNELKWSQAIDGINQALQKDTTQMDIYRIRGKVPESIAITRRHEEYLKAVELAPNYTPL